MRKKVLIGVGAACVLGVLWITTYQVRSAMIDNEVKQLVYAEDLSEEGLPEVLDVIVDVESSTYQLNELPGVSDLPTLVDVTITYVDGSTTNKPAYVVYDDISEPQYEDGKYGKVILPRPV